MIKKNAFIFALLSFTLNCDSVPLDFLQDPRTDVAAESWTGEWILYGDKLETGGGVIFEPSDDNQSIDLKFKDPVATERKNVIKYSWNGKDVAGQHVWSGVSFSVATNSKTYNITPTRDLSFGGYKKLTFWAKTNLTDKTVVRFTGPIPFFSTQQDDDCDWKQFTISFKPNMLRSVKDYFIISFQYNGNAEEGPGKGGTVYVDDIRYER